MQTLLPMVERSRKNPYEISIAIALAALSLYGIFLTPASASLDAGLSVGQRFLYSALGLLGSGITLLGLRCKHPHTGLLVERAGQFMMGFGAAAFVAVLCKVSTFDQSGLVTGSGAAIAVAAFWRFHQINVDLRTWHERATHATAIVEAAIAEVVEKMPDLEADDDA
jgi:hypothetical protein